LWGIGRAPYRKERSVKSVRMGRESPFPVPPKKSPQNFENKSQNV